MSEPKDFRSQRDRVEWIEVKLNGAIVEQCKAAGTACFVKQLGREAWYAPQSGPWLQGYGSRKAEEAGYSGVPALRDAKGGDMREWPVEVRVRQFPEVAHA